MQLKNTAPVHISDFGAILCDSAQLLLPTPSSPQGSVQRSPRVLLVLVEAPPLDPGVSEDGHV